MCLTRTTSWNFLVKILYLMNEYIHLIAHCVTGNHLSKYKTWVNTKKQRWILLSRNRRHTGTKKAIDIVPIWWHFSFLMPEKRERRKSSFFLAMFARSLTTKKECTTIAGCIRMTDGRQMGQWRQQQECATTVCCSFDVLHHTQE